MILKKKQVNLRLNPGVINKIKQIQTHFLLQEELSKSQADIVELAVMQLHDSLFSGECEGDNDE